MQKLRAINDYYHVSPEVSASLAICEILTINLLQVGALSICIHSLQNDNIVFPDFNDRLNKFLERAYFF